MTTIKPWQPRLVLTENFTISTILWVIPYHNGKFLCNKQFLICLLLGLGYVRCPSERAVAIETVTWQSLPRSIKIEAMLLKIIPCSYQIWEFHPGCDGKMCDYEGPVFTLKSSRCRSASQGLVMHPRLGVKRTDAVISAVKWPFN